VRAVRREGPYDRLANARSTAGDDRHSPYKARIPRIVA
jgi:hypothetical protein